MEVGPRDIEKNCVYLGRRDRDHKDKISLKVLTIKFFKLFLAAIYIAIVFILVFGGIPMGIWTLLPDEAKKPCYLGYYAHCSFTPFSTIILFGMTILGIILLMKLKNYLKSKYREWKDKN